MPKPDRRSYAHAAAKPHRRRFGVFQQNKLQALPRPSRSQSTRRRKADGPRSRTILAAPP
jgi:hypothetical protein